MSANSAYLHYWRRKELLAAGPPHFPVRRWWPSEGLSESERLTFDAVANSSSILDVGAGDLKHRRKFQAAGFTAVYHTLDIGEEFDYEYSHIDEVSRNYESILCFDVIEHLPLEAGLDLLRKMAARLEPNGVMVVQTPNARCVRDPLSWDMTHLHCYNAGDLWAYLTCLGLTVNGYRVVFSREHPGLLMRIQGFFGAYLVTRLLGCDYADNLLMIARRPADHAVEDQA